MDPQSGAIKRRGCVYSGICLFPFSFFSFLLPLLRHRGRATARFLSYSRRRSRRIYALSVVGGTTEEGGRERGTETSRVEIEESEKDGEKEGGKRRKNHDAIIFVPARERILSSSSRAG